MAKRKKTKPWDSVFSRVRGVHFAEWSYPPKTTPAELDEVEQKLGVRFPLSYRAFAERFGLGGWVRGYVELLPLQRPATNTDRPVRWGSVVKNTEGIRETWGQPDNDNRIRLWSDGSQLVDFAWVHDDINFAFYPPNVTDKKSRECCIYAWSRDEGWQPYVDSFPEWLSRTARFFHERPDGTPEDEAKERKLQLVYKPSRLGPRSIPYWLNSDRNKTAPSAKNVNLWLAFNNHTVRNLALAVRDEKRPDAFPILADALEEAGCTNADMLESCRHGDPDIDGLWVLRVLLDSAK